jgi:ATP-binding cassette subfamily C protein CydC
MKIIWRLLDFVKPFTKEVLLSVLIGVATIGAGIGMMGTSAYLISMAALHPSIAELQVAIVGVRFFGISRGVFRYLERLVSHSVNLKVLTRLRVWIYEGAEKIAPAGLQSQRGGDLLNRLMADVETLENFYVRVISPILVAFVITLGMSLFLGSYFLPLGIILAVGMILNGLLLPTLSILMTRNTGNQLSQTRAMLSADMLETFQGLEDLQAACAENRWLQKVESGSKSVGRIQLYYGFLDGLNDGLLLLVSNLTLLAILIAAIPAVVAGLMSGVSLAVVSLLSMASFEATNPLPHAAQNLTASVASARRILEMIGSGPINTTELPELSPQQIGSAERIEIRDLSFAYPGSEDQALQHINLTIERGKITALVGPSGAGKTSLVNLLVRFWEPNNGEILLDGKDLQQYSGESVRRLFGVISQSNYFFAGTLRDNLLLADPQAKETELLAAIHTAELGPWFDSLPDGLNTWLGEQGARLSGGEAQRLAIARVLLQKPPFILLDEPISHLDTETEKNVLTTLFRVFTDKGVLMITHNLAMLDKTNEIIFISEGNVLERGNQSQLLLQNQAYAHFWDLKRNEIRVDLPLN